MKINSIQFSEQLKKMKGTGAVEPLDTKSKDLGVGHIGEAPKESFGEFLLKQVEKTNNVGIQAERAIQRSIEGKEPNPHSTLIAVQKASVSLTLMMGIKQRLEQTYQELIRTQI